MGMIKRYIIQTLLFFRWLYLISYNDGKNLVLGLLSSYRPTATQRIANPKGKELQILKEIHEMIVKSQRFKIWKACILLWLLLSFYSTHLFLIAKTIGKTILWMLVPNFLVNNDIVLNGDKVKIEIMWNLLNSVIKSPRKKLFLSARKKGW